MEKLTPEERVTAIDHLQSYFLDEREEEIGDLAAGILLDFIETHLGASFYNRGVRDAKALMDRFAVTLDEELEVLEIRSPLISRDPQ